MKFTELLQNRDAGKSDQKNFKTEIYLKFQSVIFVKLLIILSSLIFS